MKFYRQKWCETIEFIALKISITEGKGIEYGVAAIIPICEYNSKINIIIEILGITVNQIVTIVGLSLYTSIDQLCKGAAAILNKNPTIIIIRPKLIPAA